MKLKEEINRKHNMKNTVIQDNFVCLWNILLFCEIFYKLLWKYVAWEGRQR